MYIKMECTHLCWFWIVHKLMLHMTHTICHQNHKLDWLEIWCISIFQDKVLQFAYNVLDESYTNLNISTNRKNEIISITIKKTIKWVRLHAHTTIVSPCTFQMVLRTIGSPVTSTNHKFCSFINWCWTQRLLQLMSLFTALLKWTTTDTANFFPQSGTHSTQCFERIRIGNIMRCANGILFECNSFFRTCLLLNIHTECFTHLIQSTTAFVQDL